MADTLPTLEPDGEEFLDCIDFDMYLTLLDKPYYQGPANLKVNERFGYEFMNTFSRTGT
ncbi:MAG: hypothetical protein ACR2O0_07740 [Rhizobiaceae bacterium]